MKIGICSPFMPQEVEDLLDPPSRSLLAEIGGVTATPVVPLVRLWHEQGQEVAVFCLDQSVVRPLRLVGDRISIDVLPKRRFRESLVDCYRVERELLGDAVMGAAPDVLSAQWSYEHALGAIDTGMPTVVTCHDTPLRYAWTSKNFFMSYHVFVAAMVIRRARGLVCVSPYTARHIRRFFRPRCEPVTIPNGIPRELLERGKRRLLSSSSPGGLKTICSIGGWGRLKNVKTLLKAFSMMRFRSSDPARLVLFGKGLGAGGDAEQWAKARNFDGGVEFRGSVPYESILDFLEAEAGLMVHPSLVETHGMVLVEAMACGVPVIGGERSGAVPWTLGDGRYGRLCRVRSAKALARTMESALRDKDGTKKLAGAAWDSVAERFLIEHTAANNLQVLLETSASGLPAGGASSGQIFD
ncbi:glycosyltransferase family 4 protein [Haloferula sp. A504]|uniref:glycosyltransferase family 4 protein n=1 Tax=Haloferula sp. A504 TaxID=3373601 RepID=UPI0031C3396D|nr:glycosyltransferase family 4 protein [Verrucomicrobiaceae bacterium E54]